MYASRRNTIKPTQVEGQVIKSLALSPIELRRETTVNTGLYELVFCLRSARGAADQGGHLVEPYATRRDLLLTALLAALPFRPTGAAASPLNPAQTIIEPPDALQWETQPSFP